MKSRVALIAAAMLASAVALAGPHQGPSGPDMDRMAVLLDLNDSQKAEVQKILNEQHQKLEAKHQELQASGTKPTREEREKFHAHWHGRGPGNGPEREHGHDPR